MLGLFSEQELRSLYSKGRLTSTDEVLNDTGIWITLQVFISKLPPSLPPKKQTATSANPTTIISKSTTGSKPKVSYLKLWLMTTLWIYGIGSLLGFLSAGSYGLGMSLVLGLFLAPIKGAFWAWIIWLFKK